MRRAVVWAVAVSGLAAGVLARPAGAVADTWTGEIADGMCALAGHAHMGATDARTCTLECVKANQPFAFAVDKKVFKIANQKFPQLETYAGLRVQLTGELKGDTITVAKIAKAPAK
jgi:hypothetical protein